MCGIFGTVGTDIDAAKKVFSGLSDIEYRGYDSWGIAIWEDTEFSVKKQIGFLPREIKVPDSKLAIGHTRWATHGGVTKENAHPHLSCDEGLALVHNGIVENYLELKNELKTHRFKSETDSEVIIHLIEDEMKQKKDLSDAVSSVFNRAKGLNAFVVSDGKQIVVCKIGSPLVVGKSDNSLYVASDPNAILPFTNNLLFIEDGQLVILDKKIEVFNAKSMQPIEAKITKVVWEYSKASMAKFPHFMLKEIHEQPQVLYNQIQELDMLEKIAGMIKRAYGTYFVGCGTASYACLSGVYLFSKFAKKHVNFSIGSEFNYVQDFLEPKSLLIAVSQSGETIDIVEPVSKAKKIGSKIVSLTNTLGSTLYRMSDEKMLLLAGPEKAVASTKAYIAMLANMILLSFAVAGPKSGGLKTGIKIIEKSAKEIENILVNEELIHSLAKKIKAQDHMHVLGRGLSYPLALESALKIKEVSYIHAEGFASGELKHGTIALIDKGIPVLVYLPNDETRDAVLSNAMEVKSRGAFVIGVGSAVDGVNIEENPVFDFFFKVADCGASSILPHVVFAQLLGYFLAVEKGLNPDKPRNLAKSVVVR